MGKLLIRKWGSFFLVLMLAVSVSMLTGCDGDDGAPGADGKSAYEIAVDNGFVGTEQEWLDSLTPVADTATPESCGVCHNDIAMTHADAEVTVENIVAALNAGGDLEVTFDVLEDGIGSDAYTLRRAYGHYDDPANPDLDPAVDYITTFVRATLCSGVTACADDPYVLFANNGGGNYTVTVAAEDLTDPLVPISQIFDDSNYLFQLTDENPDGESRPTVIIQYGAAHLRDLVTNEACASCHGPYPAYSEKFNHYAVGGSECQICHSQYSRSTTFLTRVDATTFTEAGLYNGTNITEYIHGIHNSHNMPDGVYYRTDAPDATADNEDRYSVGYPSAMNYCAVCHTEPAQLDAAVSAPVSYYLCMTCHQNWDGFVHTHDADDGSYAAGDPIFAAGNFHRTEGPDTNCMGCHGASASLDEAADFHNDFQSTDRHYDSFYRGEDISFSNPNAVDFAIEGVTVAGDAVSFTWSASNAGGAVDPCNADVAAGPVFTDLGAYLAYAKGDDWVNEFVGSSPGQPERSSNLFTTLATVCDAATNVATTTGLTLDPDATYADRVLLAIGGKPVDQGSFVIGAAATDKAFYVRVPSPTYAFDPADGTSLDERRRAVETEKCLSCHRGTLYQHGGDRVDNEQLCVICHNPASSDKNNRQERYEIVNADGTVNTDATYDGLESQSYDMRYMIHSIHGVSKRDKPWVIYRSRGIYYFRTADMTLPANWPADGMTIAGSMNDSTILHNDIVVHYPQPVNNCEACHTAGLYEAPDQTKAVALTVDAGTVWPDQSDDRVIGPTAGACTACHYNAAVRSHAKQFGYDANVTKDEMLELAQ